MPTINNTNLTEAFTYINTGEVDFASHVNHSSTFYTWLTSNGNAITVQGTGITVNGSNIPTGGTITSVSIDLSNNSPLLPDIQITDVSFDLSALIFTAEAASAEAFWLAVLAGPVTVLGGATFETRFGGDFLNLSSAGTTFGSDDSFFGDDVDNCYAYGEGNAISDGTLVAGSDSFSGSFDVLFADVSSVTNNARLVGGDDAVVFTQDWTDDSFVAVFGDASSAFGTSTVICGNDLIDISVVTSTSATNQLTGDVSTVSGSALVVAGDDTLYGSQANDVIYGDVNSLNNPATLIAGNDVV
ncbi:MAG: hypothetical protein LJE68_11825, partial [Rhodobacter sp.]|nr:hypothetical protein [Rhodobacter sp.]